MCACRCARASRSCSATGGNTPATSFYEALTQQHLDHVTPCPACRMCWRPEPPGRKASFPTRRARSCGGRWRIWAGPVLRPGDRRRRRDRRQTRPGAAHLALAQLGRSRRSVRLVHGRHRLDMQAARAAGVTAVLIGNADHDGGVERAAPHIHFPSAHDLRARLRDLA